MLRGVRFIMKLVRTEPLRSVMDFKPNNNDQSSYFWPGDVDPDKVNPLVPYPLVFLLTGML